MIKKIFFIFAAAVLTASFAQAQFNFGVRGGFNYSDFMVGDAFGKFIPGFQAGIVAELPTAEKTASLFGVLFSTQGFQGDMDGVPTKIVLNNLTVPINTQIKYNWIGQTFVVQGGAYLSYALNGKITETKRGVTVTKDLNFDEVIQKRFDFGVILGAGPEFGNLQVGLGYHMGMMGLFSEPGYSNFGLALTATYLIRR